MVRASVTWLGWSEKNCMGKGGKGQVGPTEESLGEEGTAEVGGKQTSGHKHLVQTPS